MTEDKYKRIFDDYLSNKSDVNSFIDNFMNQWRADRDNSVNNDGRFQRIIDRIFTNCDCYTEAPQGEFEISEKSLKEELELLIHIWYG